MRALVEVLDQAALHDDADGDHDRNREQDGQRHRPVDDRGPCGLAKHIIDIRYLDLRGIAQEVGFRLVNDSVAES